jgi:cytochrome c oxidase cbb3-type subunit III
MNRINRRILFALSLFAALSAARGAALADAAETFKFYCAQCHGVSGKGDGPNVTKNFPVSPRDFTNAKEMNKLSNADLKNVIMDGGPSASKSPMMPPWGKTLEESDIDALVKHLRVLCKCTGKPG